jgi:hypothetical protein
MLEGSALKLAGAVDGIQRIAARHLVGKNEGIGTDEWSGN